ncbi:hypothetical protein EVAR_64236_1 [Eumeta japonica]|uniref:Uncharacterized protein n=1 Tax=Eumeta variegata TaxID=151549 RepID=A0A4C1Z7F2_EUMVA|nr:hypothetical protein EVAR_64236_1 [Eumeta japonica]
MQIPLYNKKLDLTTNQKQMGPVRVSIILIWKKPPRTYVKKDYSKQVSIGEIPFIGLEFQTSPALGMIYDLHYNKHDCAALISMLCYRVPYRAQQAEDRPHHLFTTNRCRTAAGTRSPVRRLADTCTKFKSMDIITSTVGSFKKDILHTLNRACSKLHV